MALDCGSNSAQLMTATPGHKRIRPPDEPDGEQRLSKRLDRLSLDNRNRCYVPVTAASHSHGNDCSTHSPSTSSKHDSMEVDNTKDRIYIHDLEQELADIESDEEHPIFLPDIEKHLLKLPYNVLMNDADKQRMENMQLVLYKVPSSLTLSEEQDNVRKAIIEARERARLRKSQSTECDNASSKSNGVSNNTNDSNGEANDSDAMDES